MNNYGKLFTADYRMANKTKPNVYLMKWGSTCTHVYPADIYLHRMKTDAKTQFTTNTTNTLAVLRCGVYINFHYNDINNLI